MERNNRVAAAVRRALIMSALTTGGAAVPALAQDNLAEITVTGSRIVRQDYEAASPVVSLTAESFEATGAINAETLVNTLPQVAPSFSQGNNNPGNGQSWINLRGLGSVRNLVLVDGKRMIPSNSGGIVDINTIPTHMIERLELITGGASAVYGSDAVAGATNFILKKNFSGVDLDVQYGVSEESDTEVMAADVTMGSDLADGRGNVVFYGSVNDRERLGKGDREFSAQAVSATSFFPSGHLRRVSGNTFGLTEIQDLFTNTYGTSAPTSSQSFSFNDDGTVFSAGQGGEGLHNFRTVNGEDINGLFVAQNFLGSGPDDSFYSYNFEPWNNLVLPQTRVSFGAIGNFAVSDSVEVYSRLMYTNYNSSIQLAPSPAPTGTNLTNPGAGTQFSIPVTNPFVQANPSVLALANSRTGDNAGLAGTGANEDLALRYRFNGNGPRVESYERDVHQYLLGTRGDITGSWKFDVYAAAGRYNEQLDQDGNVSVTRVESLLDAPDGGASICEGGFNPFGYSLYSQECADYMGVIAKNTTQIVHNMAEAVVTGDVFNLPAGSVSTAVGVFWQEFDFRFLADEILATGDVAGFNAQDNISGRTAYNDAFTELYVPILKDMPGVQSLALTLGYRYSDHNVAGGNSSYKGELDWRVNEAIRFRGGYQRAVRAPNVGELFSPIFEDNPQVDDPCNFNSGVRNGSSAAQAEALCLAQGIAPADIDTYLQSTSQIEAITGGNPELFEETADTYTLGFVWTPGFADQFSVSVDYFDIEVSDVIGIIDPSIVVTRCFNSGGFNPNFELNNFYCSLFSRSSITNEIHDLQENLRNLGGLKVKGVDLQVDYGFNIGTFGDIRLNLVTTFTDENSQQQLPGDIFIDYVGTIGQQVAEVSPDYKGTLSATWNYKDFSTLLRWNYIPSMDHKETVNFESKDPDICGCTGVDSYSLLSLSSGWQVTDEFSIRLGVDNLLDEEPQLYTPDQDSGTNPGVYDVVGRRYFMTASYKF